MGEADTGAGEESRRSDQGDVMDWSSFWIGFGVGVLLCVVLLIGFVKLIERAW